MTEDALSKPDLNQFRHTHPTAFTKFMALKFKSSRTYCNDPFSGAINWECLFKVVFLLESGELEGSLSISFIYDDLVHFIQQTL